MVTPLSKRRFCVVPKRTLPGPASCDAESRMYVLPKKLVKPRVAPDATVKVELLVPPPDRASVPVSTSTSPVLLNRTPSVVVPLLASLRTVPALLKLGVPMKLYTEVSRGALLRMSRREPSGLFQTALLLKEKPPVPAQVAVPRL